MTKELCTTTDFMDDLRRSGRHFTEQDLDAMMAYCASLGSKRHEWIFCTRSPLYDEDGPVGFDLLAAACEAAHRHGMRFDAILKPFEGGIGRPALPLSAPRPAGVPWVETPAGLVHDVRPFVAAHPEMRMARHPDDGIDPGGRITTIRLIKSDDKPARFSEQDLSIWTSATNGDDGFKRYDGPVSFHETVERRATYLSYQDVPCRVLTFADLAIPDSARYIVVRCASTSPDGDFRNRNELFIELVNEHGQAVPCTVSQGPADPEQTYRTAQRQAELDTSRYFRHPEVQAMLRDRDSFLARCRGMHRFEGGGDTHVTLDRDGEVAVMRGKPRHTTGVLNPIYAEVREHWLEQVRFCIDRGVDGVNIRVANHNRPSEPWANGFNEPVLAQMTHTDDTAEAAKVNGDAYTQFLHQARDLLHSHNREIGVHIHALMFQPDNKHGGPWGPIPMNIEWQWEQWVRDIADYVEFRGANMLLPPNIRGVCDRIGLATRQAGIPFIFQSTRGQVMHFEGPYKWIAEEMAWARRHPDITTYNLYETGEHYTRMNEQDQLVGSADMAELVRRLWHAERGAHG